MKHSPSRRAEKPAHRQFVQTLEPRRLMSVTAGLELPAHNFQHVDTGPMEVTHDFSLAQPEFFHGDDAGAFAQATPFSPMFQGLTPNGPDGGVHAVTAWPDTDTAATAADTTAAMVQSPNTLYAIYSTIGHSSVAQIDSASTQSLATTLDTAMQDQADGSFTSEPTASVQGPSQFTSSNAITFKLADGAVISQTAANVTDVTSDAALARALSVVDSPIAGTTSLALPTVNQDAAPSWTSLRKLEDELVSVRAFANQVVSEIGREGAIALSHLESLMDSNAGTALSGHSLSTWRSLAAAGTILAGVAYAQSKAESEKQKPGNVFSTRMIELVATGGPTAP